MAVKLRSDGVSWREIDGEMVILDLSSSTYLTTNRTGAFLMRLLAEESSVEDLVATLIDEFEISRERATEDVEQFVRVLREKGLLESSELGAS